MRKFRINKNIKIGIKPAVVAFFILHIGISFSQNDLSSEIDSLKLITKSNQPDTSKIRAYNFLAHYYGMMDSTWSIDSSMHFIDKSKAIMRSTGNETYSSYPYIKAHELEDKRNNHEKSLEYLLEYRDVAQKFEKINWEGDALSEIIALFDRIKDTIRATEYVDQLIPVIDKMTSHKRKAACYNYLGTHYKDIGENQKALEAHENSLKIRLENGMKKSAATSYNNIGIVYKNMEMYSKALEYYKLSLEIKEERNDIKGMAGTNINIAKVYLLDKRYREGLPYVKKGIELTFEAKAYQFQMVGYEVLYKLEKEVGNFKAALVALEKHLELDAEIMNKTVIKQAKEFERKYETEKRKQQVLLLKKDQEIKDLEIAKQDENISRQNTVIMYFIIGLIIVSILVVFLVISRNQKAKINAELSIRNKEIQSQKEETDFQKTLVDIKNKEITDSINYAKKIQSSILPPKSKVEELLKDSFILYKPKDIVAGDFYWVEKVDKTIYYTAADCTGHGVPGAMVSVVCANILSKVLLEEGLSKPSEILDRSRELVVEHFERGEEVVKDGMDLALVALHLDENDQIVKAEYAGANNPFVLIPKNAELENIIELKATKQPIGKQQNPTPFENHEIALSKGDTIYIYTDGYQDQFGGEHKGGKKLKSKNLIKLLHSYHRFDMTEQPEKLSQAFHKWQGDLEQVDDVCVIGVRV